MFRWVEGHAIAAADAAEFEAKVVGEQAAEREAEGGAFGVPAQMVLDAFPEVLTTRTLGIGGR